MSSVMPTFASLRLFCSPDNLVVHHHNELSQINFSVMVNIHFSHDSVQLITSWVPAKSSQQIWHFFPAQISTAVLVKITESLDHSQNKFFRDSKLFGQKYSNLMTIFSW